MSVAAHNLGLRFQLVVDTQPQAPAVFCDGRRHDFLALNTLANRYSRWLAACGVSHGKVVCLELPKTIEAYGLAIACIKIGAPHSFLHPASPADGAGMMLDRCKPALIVSVRPGEGNRVVLADEGQRESLSREIAAFDGDNLSETAQITGADPAYVMFTSGSTGEPKGAV